MKQWMLWILAVTMLWAVPAVSDNTATNEDAATESVRIYLLRETKLETDTVVLDQVAVIRCDDAALKPKVCRLALGRGPLSGETLKIDRKTILSRLSTVGIDVDDVRMTGAMSVAVSRAEKTVSAAKILAAAAKALEKGAPAPDGAAWQPARQPTAMTVPASRDVTISAKIARKFGERTVVVGVTLQADGQTVGTQLVQFALGYSVKQVVATEDIASGTMITEKNTRVVTVPTTHPPREPFRAPYGYLATYGIRKGMVIRANMLRAVRPQQVIRRNSPILMKVEGPGYSITAKAVALQDGRVGEIIKVMNADSKKVVMGKVLVDGSVEPVME